VSDRWKKHRYCARAGTDTHFYRALRKYGPDSFCVHNLGRVATKSEADNLENVWIALLQTKDHDFGFNSKNGGDGARHSPETRAKISVIQKASPRSRAYYQGIARLARSRKGSHLTPEQQALD
jgi:hypothetical protein